MVPSSLPLTLDIDKLLAPISDESPGGDHHAYSRGLRTQLAERRNPDRSSNPDDPDRDGGMESIDWTKITELAETALQTTTKDLRVACHLTEAAMHRWGLAGLRTGLILLRRLSESCWDDLAPAIDPDDPEVRCAPLENLLDDPNHGPRLPSVLRGLPILPTAPQPISLLTAMATKDEKASQEAATAIAQISTERAGQVSSELDETIAELDALQHALLERLGEYAPTFLHLGESLQLLRQWLDQVLQPQLEANDTGESQSSSHADSNEMADQSPGRGDIRRHDSPAGALRRETSRGGESPEKVLDQTSDLRAEAYQQLSRAAEVLQRIEPHSPIPYMVQRAVQLGQLPLPQLMTVLVREESTLEMFSRELGLSGVGAESSADEP